MNKKKGVQSHIYKNKKNRISRKKNKQVKPVLINPLFLGDILPRIYIKNFYVNNSLNSVSIARSKVYTFFEHEVLDIIRLVRFSHRFFPRFCPKKKKLGNNFIVGNCLKSFINESRYFSQEVIDKY